MTYLISFSLIYQTLIKPRTLKGKGGCREAVQSVVKVEFRGRAAEWPSRGPRCLYAATHSGRQRDALYPYQEVVTLKSDKRTPNPPLSKHLNCISPVYSWTDSALHMFSIMHKQDFGYKKDRRVWTKCVNRHDFQTNPTLRKRLWWKTRKVI